MLRLFAFLLVLVAPLAYAQTDSDAECGCDEFPLRLEIFTWVEDARRAVKLADVEDGGTINMTHRAAEKINIRAVYHHPDAYRSAIRVREDRPGGFRGSIRYEHFTPWTAFGDEVNVELNSLAPWVVDIQFFDSDREQLIDERISFTIRRSGVEEQARILVEGDPAKGAVNIEDKVYLLDPEQPHLLAHDLKSDRRDSSSDIVLQGDYLAENWGLVTGFHYDESDEMLYVFRTGRHDPVEDIFFHKFTADGAKMGIDETGTRLPVGLDILGVRNGGQIVFPHEEPAFKEGAVLNQDNVFNRKSLRYVSLDDLDLGDPDLDLATMIDYSYGILELDGELNYDISGAVNYEGVYYISDPVSARIFAYESLGPRLRAKDIHRALVANGNTQPVSSFVHDDMLYVGDPRYSRLYRYSLDEEAEDGVSGGSN